MAQKTRERSKNLDDLAIAKIVEILDGYSGKLTWDSLISDVELKLKELYTRQTLSKHTRIKSAYDLTKERLKDRSANNKVTSPEIQILLQKIEKLKAQNARLEKENNNLLMQFIIWSRNASAKGLTKDDLDLPLPNINRT